MEAVAVKPEPAALQLYGHKLIYHLDAVEKWLAGDEIFPLHLDIGPFGGCNHRCAHCYVEYLGHQGLSLREDAYVRLMRDIGACGVKSVFIAGTGEPTLNKATPDAIVAAHESGVDVAMATNGVFTDEETAEKILPHMTWLRFSILADSPEVYTEIQSKRPEDWAKVHANMRACARVRDRRGLKVTLGAYMCVLPQNVREVVPLARRVRDYGFDYIIVKPPTQNPKNKFDFPRDLHVRHQDILEEAKALATDRFRVFMRFDLFGDEARAFEGKNIKSYGRCYGLPFIGVVDADGGVYTCTGYWRDRKFCYGSLYEKSFREIWEGARRREIHARIEGGDLDLAACEPLCRQHNINKFLWQLKNPPAHSAFI